MQSHHIIKPNLLQCNRCQEEFKNQDLLKSHEMNVDCPIRCPNCREEFEKKTMRQAHQEEKHIEETKESRFMEIDDAMDKKIKENLKAYVDSLKKGKGPISHALEQWIAANTARYMIGRSSKANPKLELGQWYTIFSTLASETKVLEHPCKKSTRSILIPILRALLVYDYGLSPSDLVEERILLINENMIDARIKIHGPPPRDLQLQRNWYQDVLRESLKVAAKTRLVLHKKSETPDQQDTSNASLMPSYSHESCASGVQGMGYNLPVTTAPHDMTPGYHMTASHESQLPNMSSLSRLVFSPSTFLPNDQQQAIATLSNGLSDGTSGPSSMMTGEVADLDSWIFQQIMSDGNHQTFDLQRNVEFTSANNVEFEPSGSDML